MPWSHRWVRRGCCHVRTGPKAVCSLPSHLWQLQGSQIQRDWSARWVKHERTQRSNHRFSPGLHRTLPKGLQLQLLLSTTWKKSHGLSGRSLFQNRKHCGSVLLCGCPVVRKNFIYNFLSVRPTQWNTRVPMAVPKPILLHLKIMPQRTFDLNQNVHFYLDLRAKVKAPLVMTFDPMHTW